LTYNSVLYLTGTPVAHRDVIRQRIKKICAQYSVLFWLFWIKLVAVYVHSHILSWCRFCVNRL